MSKYQHSVIVVCNVICVKENLSDYSGPTIDKKLVWNLYGCQTFSSVKARIKSVFFLLLSLASGMKT